MEKPEYKQLGTPQDLASILAKYMLADEYKFRQNSVDVKSKTITVGLVIKTKIDKGNLYPSNLSFQALNDLFPDFRMVTYGDDNLGKGFGEFPTEREYNLPDKQAEASPPGLQGAFMKKLFLWQMSECVCKYLDPIKKKEMNKQFKDPRERKVLNKLMNTIKNKTKGGILSKRDFKEYR
ncbi:hypothetical protein CWS43_10965 [Rahnella sp. AA]|uniref:hypothetical protein n=1 Tax=Rahnella sp. AA TaxID=2057180 RepID=UPI000C334A8D|nr:hypothetical protein [Rahnella sp. AA]PKE30147.1 hypothetical protein CWS43_10965 [Rahnella sp. AA]